MTKNVSGATLSILERLIDYEPEHRQETPMSHSLSLRLLKDAVRRDVERLLNTRRIADEPDEKFKELGRSVYTFGLPDLSRYSVASPSDHAKLLRHISATLKTFEPRLDQVKIIPSGSEQDTHIQELRLRIEAVLLSDPAPEPISFDTIIELKSGACTVGGNLSAG